MADVMLETCIQAVRIGSGVAARAQRACMGTASNKATKADLSPVTVGDFAVQACISHVLAQAFPEIRLLGEEDDESFRKLPKETQQEIVLRVNEALPDLKADTEKVASLIGRGGFGKSSGDVPPCFVLDPIDGTKGFLRGEQYAVCLGLLERDGTASIGVLGCPNMPRNFFQEEDHGNASDAAELGFLFEARLGTGMRMRKLFLNPGESDTVLKEWKSSSVPPNSMSSSAAAKIRFAESYEKSHTTGHLNQLLLKDFDVSPEDEQNRVLRIDSQVKFAALARGDVQVYFRFTSFEISTWDVLPGYVVITEAGGRVTNKHGEPIVFDGSRTIKSNSLIATGAGLTHVHDKLLTAIAKGDGKSGT